MLLVFIFEIESGEVQRRNRRARASPEILVLEEPRRPDNCAYAGDNAYLRTCGETYWRRLSFGVVKRQVEDSLADIENIRSGFLWAGRPL